MTSSSEEMKGRIRLKVWLRRFGMAAVVVLFVMEGVARLLVLSPQQAYFNYAQGYLSVTSPGLGSALIRDSVLFWRFRPGVADQTASFNATGKRVDYRFSTDSAGFRSTGHPGASSGKRVLTLGGSCTFGLGVEDGAAWPAQLETILGDGVHVANAGVPGYSSFQGLELLRGVIDTFKPDLVIVDFWRHDMQPWALEPDPACETARFLAERILRHCRLVSALLDSFEPQRIPRTQRWEGPPVDTAIVEHAMRTLEPKQMVDLIRRNVQEYQTEMAHLAELVPIPPGMNGGLTPEELAANLEKIVTTCKEHNIPALFLIWPLQAQILTPGQLSPHQQSVKDTGARAQVIVADLKEVFQRAPVDPYLDMTHANSDGCRLVAQALAPLVARLLK